MIMLHVHSVILTFELHRDKTNKMACAPSKDSDQPDQSLRCPLEESCGP